MSIQQTRLTVLRGSTMQWSQETWMLLRPFLIKMQVKPQYNAQLFITCICDGCVKDACTLKLRTFFDITIHLHLGCNKTQKQTQTKLDQMVFHHYTGQHGLQTGRRLSSVFCNTEQTLTYKFVELKMLINYLFLFNRKFLFD